MRKQEDTELEIDLLELLRALLHKAWIIILVTILSGVALFSYAKFFVTPIYQASAMMYVNNSSISVGSTSFSLSDLNAAQSLVNTYVVILKSRATLTEVKEELNLEYSYEQLKNMIVAAPVDSTEVFEIIVTSPSPEEAKLIANKAAEILPNKIASIMDGSSARIVDYAVTPSSQVSPNVMRYTGLGVLLGFVLSCAVIIILKLMDQTIQSEDYLTENYKYPVLSLIPELSHSSTSSGARGYNYEYYQQSKSGSGKES